MKAIINQVGQERIGEERREIGADINDSNDKEKKKQLSFQNTHFDTWRTARSAGADLKQSLHKIKEYWNLKKEVYNFVLTEVEIKTD